MDQFAALKLGFNRERKFLKFIKQTLRVEGDYRTSCAVLGFILVTQYAAIAVFLRRRQARPKHVAQLFRYGCVPLLVDHIGSFCRQAVAVGDGCQDQFG